MINALVNKPNRVLERQKLVQASHAPIYLRLPRSRLYVGSYYALFSVAMVSTGYGVYQLLAGKPQE